MQTPTPAQADTSRCRSIRDTSTRTAQKRKHEVGNHFSSGTCKIDARTLLIRNVCILK